MCRISFVVPVYKVEEFLDECITSIIGQNFGDFEVVLVDDGSPDNCPEICDKWAQKDARIRVIHKQNGGLSDARNVGLTAAKGDYVWFVDSDDYIKSNCVNALLTQAEKDNLDLLKFYYEQVPNRLNNKLVSSPLVTGTELIFDVDTGEVPMTKDIMVGHNLCG